MDHQRDTITEDSFFIEDSATSQRIAHEDHLSVLKELTRKHDLLKTEIRWMAENAPHLDFSLALKRAEAGVRGSASPDLHLEQMEAK